MKIKAVAGLVVGTVLMSGCVTLQVAQPTEEKITVEPFMISVPKSLENGDSLLKGVRLGSFQNTKWKQSIADFYSVQFKEVKASSELTTEICRGDLHRSGGRYQSCVYYDARVSVEEAQTGYRIAITPYRVRSVQGKNAIFLPIDLPKVSIKNWYAWVSSQTVFAKYKSTAQYAPESIKGNFDRNLKKNSWQKGKSDAALKQFKDNYVIRFDDKVETDIGAAFFPYRDGALVEALVVGKSFTKNGKTSQDWSAVLAKVTAKLDQIVKE